MMPMDDGRRWPTVPCSGQRSTEGRYLLQAVRDGAWGIDEMGYQAQGPNSAYRGGASLR